MCQASSRVYICPLFKSNQTVGKFLKEYAPFLCYANGFIKVHPSHYLLSHRSTQHHPHRHVPNVYFSKDGVRTT